MYNAYKHKIRNSYNRKRKPIVFLSTEGKNKTETLYFSKYFHSKNINYKFTTSNYTDSIQMIDSLYKLMKNKDYDKQIGDLAFCVIDADVDKNKDNILSLSSKLSKNKNIELIISTPCFEVWYICHFLYTTKHYNSNNDVINDLRKYIYGYNKKMNNIFDLIKDRTLYAVNNARRLESSCIEAGYKRYTTDFNPSSDVYKVIELTKNI